jgi:hypothetical protein
MRLASTMFSALVAAGITFNHPASAQASSKCASASFRSWGRHKSLSPKAKDGASQHWLWEVVKADNAEVQIVEMGIDATQRAIATGAEGGSVRAPALFIIRKQNPKIKLIATGKDMFPTFPGMVVAVMGHSLTRLPRPWAACCLMTLCSKH